MALALLIRYVMTIPIKYAVEAIKLVLKDITLEFAVTLGSLVAVETEALLSADVLACKFFKLKKKFLIFFSSNNSTSKCCGNTGNTVCGLNQTCCGDLNGVMTCCNNNNQTCASNGTCIALNTTCPAANVCNTNSTQLCCGANQTCFNSSRSPACCDPGQVGCCGVRGNSLIGCVCRYRKIILHNAQL